ncbi:MAG: hypothetical protein HZB51_28655 [Chloroflexi bacterium]|nr:hypothetical protein [Chloroflexota bacterium]
MQDEQLMKLFDFDRGELQVNRRGSLSEKQKKRLAQREAGAKGCSIVLGVFLLGVALIGVVIAVSAVPAFATFDRTAALLFGGAFGVIWPLVWGTIGLVSMRRAFAKVTVQVKKVEGPINIVKAIRESYDSSNNTHSTYNVYELRVGGRMFEVEPETANVMMQGDVYAVYYADINLEDSEDPILSVESLERAK